MEDLPTKFRFIWPNSFRRRLKNQPTRSKNRLWRPCLSTNRDGMSKLQRIFHRCFLPSFGSFGKVGSEKIFQKSTNQKQELPVATMFVNESGRNQQSLEDLPQMLPTKFRFIWPCGFREDLKQNLPIRNKNCLWQPCLLMDRDEMSNLYRGPSIDASHQVSEEKIKM